MIGNIEHSGCSLSSKGKVLYTYQNQGDSGISLTLTDNRGFEANQLDIELDDANVRVKLPLRGEVLTLFIGWKGFALIGKGSFTIDEVEHRGKPDTLTIRARSADFRGTLNSRREESWYDTTLGAIAEAIATRNKLIASVTPVLASIKIPHIHESQELVRR